MVRGVVSETESSHEPLVDAAAPSLGLDGIGVYVHFPWCLKKCPYCDFLSVAVEDGAGKPTDAETVRRRLPSRAYADSVIAELHARVASAWPQGRGLPRLKTIFFGGGTPSLWEAPQLARVIDTIFQAFDASAPEVTIECNPSSVDERYFAQLLQAGVNRVSIGVQALDQRRLQFLGRWHEAKDGLGAIEAARRAGVSRISADLIHGVSEQTPQQACSDALGVVQAGAVHVSAYLLTIEAGTRFGARKRKGQLPLLSDELMADSYEAVRTSLLQQNFQHYEISNFGRPGEASQHNLGYWLGRDYLGLGTGAVGTVELPTARVRYKNLLVPERYLELWQEKGPRDAFSEGLADREIISAQTAVDEALMLGLRTTYGIDLSEMAAKRGAEPNSRQRQTLNRLQEEGWLFQSDGRWRLRAEKWLLSDAVARRLLSSSDQ